MEKEIDLSVSNYGSVRGRHYDLAILPWGATEPHNLHLPYLTDGIISHDIAVDAARAALATYGVRAMVLPPVLMGSQNPGQRDLTFCIHARYETQKAILTDIVASLHQQGLRRLLIVNGHGGNNFSNMVRDLAVDFPDFLIAVNVWYKTLPVKDYFDNPGDHADELETSVMMHYHPELVNLAEAGEGKGGGFAPETLAKGIAWIPRNWAAVTADTGIGDPSAATAAKGAAYIAAITPILAALIRDLTLPDLYMPLP